MIVSRIKVPKLCFSLCLEGHKDSPVRSNAHHYPKNQGFLSLVFLKVLYLFIKLCLALLGYDQILILKFPSEIYVSKLLVILLENIEIIEHLSTDFVVSSLKVSPYNIVGSPGPFIFEFIGLL